MSKFTLIKNELLSLADEIDAQTEQLMALKRRSTALYRQLQQLELDVPAPTLVPKCSQPTPYPGTEPKAEELETLPARMSAKQIAQHWSMGVSTWWAKVKADPNAPKSFKDGGSTYWHSHEVSEFLN